MKSLATNSTLVFSFLLLAVFGFGQTEQHLQTTFDLDLAKLSQSLKNAPDFAEKSMHQNGPAIELPMPDGTRKTFRMFRTHPMHPELAAKFPEIQTYHGKCYEDGVSAISLTITPQGLSAMIVDEKFERNYILPEGGPSANRYVSMVEPKDALANYMCPHGGHDGPVTADLPKQALQPPAPDSEKMMVNNANALGDKLRTHLLAVSCTGEYAIQQGGTVPLVMAKIVENVNAMNLVYIREVSVQFQLVANNEDVIYLDPNTDPYVNDGHHTPDLDNVHNTLTAIIGSANFDVGHLMQDPSATCPGCGGWAGVGVPCDDNGKGKGMSVQSIPVLIHEMGHQFNCAHTTDNLATRRDHIKIGNTIMGNGGIPGPSNYFHIVSADSIGRYVEQAGYCVPGTNTGNTIPMVDAGTGGMTIPKGTPFQLSGSATDPDPNTTLLYNWQQYDIGDTYNVINNRIHPVGNVPIFRNYFPTTDGNVRTIPRLPDLVNNIVWANVNGDTMDYEGLPTYSRSLTFRLVARDFEPTGGAFDYDELTFNVDGNSGPFKVTAPNTAVTWTAGTNTNITWDVANTNIAPVNCATVDIFLSLDGGYTYPITIATGTSNDGSYTYSVPSGFPSYTTARVKIECATYENVVFFDISNENFTISGPCVADAGIIVPATPVTAPVGDPSLDINPAPVYGQISSLDFSVVQGGPQGNYAILDIGQIGCHAGAWDSEYSTYQFQVDKPDTFFFDVNFTTNPDGFFSLYNGSYVPNDPCQNFITSTRYLISGGFVGTANPASAYLVPGVTYTIHIHPWFSNFPVAGTISFSATDGGKVFQPGQGTPPPASDYSYTYAAVNTANGQIAALDAGADFTALPAGTYRVYGVSYKSANPPPAAVNPNDFLNMTFEEVWAAAQCIVFSMNHVDMVVQPGACTPPSVGPPLVTQPTCSTTGTIAVDATGNGTLEYTVDNGANWSTNPIFSGLAPGNYTVKARLQADPTCIGTWIFNPVVLNAPSGCTPSISIAATDANKAEGNAGPTAFTFTVTRTGSTANQSTANWAVTGSGANPANGADFSGGNFPNGTVTFPAGSMAAQTVTVNVNGDVDVEPNEGFTVTLSNPVNATITTAAANGTIQNDDAAAAYCAAGATQTSDEKISNVQFNTINNASVSTAGYEDFTAVTTTVQQGSTHAFTGTISTPYASDEIIVWIDFNQDQDFDDPGEEVFNSPTGVGPHTGNISIPGGATTGNTRMRVRLHDTANGPNATPCGNSTYGQVEDYTVNITSAVPVPSIAIAATDADKAEGNAGPTAFTFTVTRTGDVTNQTTANWAVTGSGANPANGADFSGGNFPNGTVTFPAGSMAAQTVTVNVNGDVDVEPNEGFTVTLSNPVNATITTATANGNIQNDDAAAGYCAAGATNTSFEKISNVEFNTINNASVSTAGYEDFTAVTTTVQQGSTHAFTGTISNGYAEDEIIVWIDFNQDQDFDDPGEEVFNSPTGVGPHTGNIAIPGGATTGNTRMRVRLHDTANGPNATPCGNSTYGQVEDYTINITAGSGCPGGNILYVNHAAAGANNGTSWANAYTDLQAALATANSCPNITEIWVAAGTYKPTSGNDRTISFVMKNNLAIYGGFNGTETQLSERNWFLNLTFLSGDIGAPGDNTDNSYHVIRNENINNTAILDGFRITSGNANGTGEYLWGGGVYNNNASPTIKQCGIIENNALEGGGMYNVNSSSPTIINCGISFNHATLYKGGGIANSLNSSPVIVNTIFRGNTAAEWGGAIFNTGNCNPELMNCTLVANSAMLGGGIYSQFTSTPVVTNSIFWDNPGGWDPNGATFSYSLLQDANCPAGHTCGAGMIYNIDPLFVSPTDAHLQACSPAKDAGTATGAPATDFDGDARPQGAGFDMGFDENGAACSPCPNTLAVPGTIASGTYQAAMDLTSDGVVPNANTVTFKAGTGILLEPEFEVQLGATFDALIEGCVPFAPPAGGN